MSINVSVNNTNYVIPQVGNLNWGTQVTNWIAAASNPALVLQRVSTSFELASEVDFGAVAGIKLLSIKSEDTNPASAGFLKLGNTERLAWRNNANSADLTLGFNTSDQFVVNGSTLVGTVTSVNASGGTTGLTFSGGPITSTGTLTLAGTLGIPNGGTGRTAVTGGSLLYGPASGNILTALPIGTHGDVLTVSGGAPIWQTPAAKVDSITGTADRITASASTGNVTLDIAATYVGQTSITTLGTIATGVWNGTSISAIKGGTGITSYTTGDLLYASSSSALSKLPISTNGFILTLAGGLPTWAAPAASGTVTSVSGTTNRITSTGGATPVIDISASYVGQSSITTLGTIGTGVWNGTAIAVANGGTGQTTYTNGQLLIGNTTGNTLTKATLTAGTNIAITNGTGSITVAVTGTVSDATNAVNTAITDDTTTNATMYPTWVTTTTGNLPQKISSTKLKFNPSTGLLTTTLLDIDKSATPTLQFKISGTNKGSLYDNGSVTALDSGSTPIVTMRVNGSGAFYADSTSCNFNLASYFAATIEATSLNLTGTAVPSNGMNRSAANTLSRYTNGTIRETLSSAGAFRWHNYGAGTLTTDASGNITATSDIRIKNNIRPFERGLDAILTLEPILHGYTVESGLDQTKTDYAGFIAQNIQKAIPEAVSEMNDEDKHLTVSDRPIIAALVNAVKELTARLQKMENSIVTSQ